MAMNASPHRQMHVRSIKTIMLMSLLCMWSINHRIPSGHMAAMPGAYIHRWIDTTGIAAICPPHTKWTYGSNACCIYPTVDIRTRRLLVISCLDNLVKGAAGQAIQNANRLYGLAETEGLSAVPLFP